VTSVTAPNLCPAFVNKNGYAWQIAKLERKERLMRKHATDCQEWYGSTNTTHKHDDKGSPTAHHYIAAQSTNSVDLYQWVYSEEHQGDPALKVCRLSPRTRHQLLIFM